MQDALVTELPVAPNSSYNWRQIVGWQIVGADSVCGAVQQRELNHPPAAL